MYSISTSRRGFIRGLAGTGIGIVGSGVASAESSTRYIVTVRRGTHSQLEQAGFTVQRALANGRVLLVTGPATPSRLQTIRGATTVIPDADHEVTDPTVQQSPAEDTTDESLYSRQWDKHVTDVPAAHELTTGAGTQVAIIDSGIDIDHPDLAENVDEDRGAQFRKGTIRTGTGPVTIAKHFPSPAGGTTTVSQSVADDVAVHGSHLAGIAAASNNGTVGVSGTAPDATLIPLRVTYWTEKTRDVDGDGESEPIAIPRVTNGDVLTAIAYAAALGVDAVNVSTWAQPNSQRSRWGLRLAYRYVIQWAARQGTVVVVSAGNGDRNLGPEYPFFTPSTIAGAVSVSATGPNNKRAYYSNYGPPIDVGAPGGGYETRKKTLCADRDGDGDGESWIRKDTDGDGTPERIPVECAVPEWPAPTNSVLSTVPPEIYGTPHAYRAGTSMAAPQVVGTAALCRSLAPDASVPQLIQAIRQGATDSPENNNPYLGAGVLNTANTLTALPE